MDTAQALFYALKDANDNDIVTEINLETGYVNATAMCKSANKIWNNYNQNKRTKEFLLELSFTNGIPLMDLVQCRVGGNHSGTWVHPNVAIDLASWCSPKFQVAVTNLVTRYLSGQITTEESKEISKVANDTTFLVTSFHMKQVFYIGIVDCPEFKGVKVGTTDNLRKRIKDHKREIGNFQIHKVFELLNHKIVERKILDECDLLDIRRTVTINGKNQTEMVELSEDFTMEDLVAMAERVIDENKHPFIMAKNLEIDAKQLEIDEKIKELHKIEAERALAIEQERTKQMQETSKQQQIQLEMTKLHIVNSRDQASTSKSASIVNDTNNEEEEVNNIPDGTMHPIQEFIERCCEIGEDIITDRFRVKVSDIYDAYVVKHNAWYAFPALTDKEFNAYVAETYNLKNKACTWFHKTFMTWVGIRLKEAPTSVAEKLLVEFIDTECILGANYLIDTKELYDAFELYSKDKGLAVIKQNGFTRSNLRTILLKLYPDVKIKEWAINGKKHGFEGIQLRNMVSLIDIVKLFIQERCVVFAGLRVKNVDLWDAFERFIPGRYKYHVSRTAFYTSVQQLHPELTKKSVTQSDMGFVGITLKNE